MRKGVTPDPEAARANLVAYLTWTSKPLESITADWLAHRFGVDVREAGQRLASAQNKQREDEA